MDLGCRGRLVLRLDHIAEPHGVITITTGGHTYVGHDGTPPALTLFQRDGTSFKVIAVAMFVVLMVSSVELAIRTYRRATTLGIGAVVAGGCLIAFSLFGLIYGLLGVGTVGALAVLSGLPIQREVGCEV